jgi:hypothetical protein
MNPVNSGNASYVRPMRTFHHIKAGDMVIRMLGGVMPLEVTKVDGTLIHCGSWTFDRETGAEVDHGLGWGPSYGVTGTYLVHVPGEAEESN